eukprot:TRINITY_DN5985_c0_g3_i1.p1 TRINITY_DN5985_c0_g3~~TRINITY_DN5985_c0_g3_i1.p1  ORF type:complete len:200 (-),score=45.51 TRINITY_DN5985_c0_g3_i1:113-712(-)
MSCGRGKFCSDCRKDVKSIGQSFKRRSVLEKTSNIKFPHPSEVLRECFSTREYFTLEPKRPLNKSKAAKQVNSISSLADRVGAAKCKAAANTPKKNTSRGLLRDKAIAKMIMQSGKHKRKQKSKKLIVINHSLSNTSTSKSDLREKLDKLKHRIKLLLSNYKEREGNVLEYSARLKRENVRLKKLMQSVCAVGVAVLLT